MVDDSAIDHDVLIREHLDIRPIREVGIVGIVPRKRDVDLFRCTDAVLIKFLVADGLPLLGIRRRRSPAVGFIPGAVFHDVGFLQILRTATVRRDVDTAGISKCVGLRGMQGYGVCIYPSHIVRAIEIRWIGKAQAADQGRAGILRVIDLRPGFPTVPRNGDSVSAGVYGGRTVKRLGATAADYQLVERVIAAARATNVLPGCTVEDFKARCGGGTVGIDNIAGIRRPRIESQPIGCTVLSVELGRETLTLHPVVAPARNRIVGGRPVVGFRGVGYRDDVCGGVSIRRSVTGGITVGHDIDIVSNPRIFSNQGRAVDVALAYHSLGYVLPQ